MKIVHLLTALVTVMLPLSCLSQCPTSHDNCVAVTKTSSDGNGTITSTRYDDSAHAKAVGDATSASVIAAMNYFLVIRPAIQTFRNERLNRIEGQFTPVYELIDVLSANAPLVKSPLTISGLAKVKGYYLGESWQDVVNDSPYLLNRSHQCSLEQRPNLSARRKRVDFNPCSDVWRMADNPHGSMTLDCLNAGMGAGKQMICQDVNGELSFDDGKLSSLKLYIAEDWREVLPDIIAKFGQPNGIDDAGTLAIWNAETTEVIAAQIDDGVAFSWMTPEKYQASARHGRDLLAAEQPSNSLDR